MSPTWHWVIAPVPRKLELHPGARNRPEDSFHIFHQNKVIATQLRPGKTEWGRNSLVSEATGTPRAARLKCLPYSGSKVREQLFQML